MRLEKTMFREYDIRGRESESELNELSMYHIARGFARMLSDLHVKDIVVGHDARGTSESFHKAAEKGFLESGINVIDIGVVTTPMSYWAQFFLKTRGLCMVTASHNPAGWNGVKLGTDLSKTLLPDEIKKLYSIIESEEYINGEGAKRSVDIREDYMKDLLSRARIPRKLKVLVNTGNGTAGIFAPELLRKAGCEVVERFTNVDPTYPNYTPNTDGRTMMEDTGRETAAHNCDIGLAFDGDGDRLGVVDEKGAVIWPDRYMILLSRLVLSANPGAKIVFDVKVSEALVEDITAHGGVPIMCKTGHSYIKAKMIEEGAMLAGEMSGHIFFRDNFYGFDDAFFAGLKMLEYISAEGKPVSEIVASTPYYISTPTIQVETPDKEKYGIVDKLTEEFKADGHRVIDINGARVYI
ncbi:MAG: phosphomannomutase/phosphoglucomutase, partial [Candidatus Kaiserbacteria bacterium]|nr:phosphomannomutase/phosphoglucomutase [Candidatus Kaiserbacteria bacterium]